MELPARMRRTGFVITAGDLGSLAGILEVDPSDLSAALDRLKARGLVRLVLSGDGDATEVAVLPSAPRRCLDPLEQKTVDYLLRVERMQGHPHVVVVPGVCGGVPVVRGTGVAAEAIARYFVEGKGALDVQRDYPHLGTEEILDALHFALEQRDEPVAASHG